MRAIVIGTAGHIDHGKSALVQALTGTDPDRLKEERERGITIDLGFAHVAAGDVTLSFVDVPGHERFVRNMLAGAGGIDAVLLVVAADESIKPQTREHFEICRLIGIARGVVALTKADLADRDVRDLVALEVRELVAGSFLDGAPIIPVSARTGEGLADLVQALAALDGAPPRQHRTDVARLPVDRVFTMKGFGTVVTGTLVSGRVAEGEELVALPSGRRVRVRGVHIHGQPAVEAVAPSRVALNLGGVEAGAIARGVTIATPEAFAVTRRADVRLHLLPGATPLKHGARIRVHHGTDDIAARVSVAAVRPPAGAWQPARPGELGITVPPGAEAFARLRLDRPAVLTRGDALVLRTASPPSTIGGALVLDPEPASGGVRRPSALDRFERLDAAGVPVELWLREAGGRGLDRAALVRRGGFDPRAAGAHADALVARGGAWDAGGRIVDAAFVDRVAAELRAVLAEFHRASPDEAGMFREALRERVAAALAPGVFDAMLARLAAAGEVAGAERVALASHRPARSVEDGRARDAIDAILLAARLAPPDAASLATATGLALPALERVLQGLVRERKVVRLDGVCFHPQALASLRADVQALRPAGSPDGSTTIDVAAFKERYGLTRKFAIPLLEWLDRERVTRRVGEKRVIL